MEWFRSLMLPPQGSVFAGEVDTLYMFLFWLSAVLFIGIGGAAIYFAFRYRYVPGRVTPRSRMVRSGLRVASRLRSVM